MAVRICAWCKPGSPTRILGTNPELPAGTVTHGICEPCRAELLAPIRAMKDPPPRQPACCHGTPCGAWCEACESEV